MEGVYYTALYEEAKRIDFLLDFCIEKSREKSSRLAKALRFRFLLQKNVKKQKIFTIVALCYVDSVFVIARPHVFVIFNLIYTNRILLIKCGFN